MKKSISVFILLICVISVFSAALAHKETPEILSEITGKPVDEVKKLLDKGKTPYQICEASDKIPEFKEYKLKNIREKLDKAVRDGGMTENTANEYYKKAKSAIEKWDGSEPKENRPPKLKRD